MRETDSLAITRKLKPLAYLPLAPSVPDHLFQKLIDELNEYVDGRELSDKVAVGRLPGTNRWIALFHDGEGLSVFETNGEAPALADVLSAVAALANAPKEQRKSAKGVAQ
jgi:hypothetical protein